VIGLQSKRVFLPLLLTLVLVAAASGICWGIIMPSHEVYVYIDGNRLLFPDQQPYVDEMGRTMVPLRHCAQTLGATVNWDQDKQQALVKKPGPNNALTVITLAVGQKQVIIDDVTVKEMDVAPVLRYDRVMVPLRFISEYLGFEVRWDGKARSAHVFTQNQSESEKLQIIKDSAETVKELPRVNSAENLQRLLDESNSSMINTKRLAVGSAEAEAIPQSVNSVAAGDTAAKSEEYSKTNTQVQGVDEADIIKTDGEYIYMIKNNSIQVIKAFPAEQMAVESQIQLEAKPREIYIDAGRLIVINDNQRYGLQPLRLPEYTTMAKRISYYPGETSIEIYNTLDKSHPVLADEYVLGGSYVSSRKIDNKVYVITSEHIYQPYEPVYYINGQPRTKSYQEISYFPDIIHNSYLHLGQIKLGDSNQINVETFLGSGNNIYCSQDNLYVAEQHYYPRLNDYAGYAGENTVLYKFAIKDNIEYKARGIVPGTLLNQFSMDEYNNYFRIATTQSQRSNMGSSNAVYILNSDLEQVNSIEGIAPGSADSRPICDLQGDFFIYTPFSIVPMIYCIFS
jgi:inhibitor of cysteine peptidase